MKCVECNKQITEELNQGTTENPLCVHCYKKIKKEYCNDNEDQLETMAKRKEPGIWKAIVVILAVFAFFFLTPPDILFFTINRIIKSEKKGIEAHRYSIGDTILFTGNPFMSRYPYKRLFLKGKMSIINRKSFRKHSYLRLGPQNKGEGKIPTYLLKLYNEESEVWMDWLMVDGFSRKIE